MSMEFPKLPYKKIFVGWLPLAALSTVVCSLIYVTTQHSLRTSANDPQIQMVEDAVWALHVNPPPKDLSSHPADIATTLAPFLVVYDDFGKPIASTATLNGKAPSLPPGVFDYVRGHGQDRVTWQPRKGLRIAAVIEHYVGVSNGFVMAGRSLREVEKRESQAGCFAAAAWLASLVMSYALIAYRELTT